MKFENNYRIGHKKEKVHLPRSIFLKKALNLKSFKYFVRNFFNLL